MINEAIFIAHALIVFSFTTLIVRLGKEGLSAWVILQAVLANFFVLKQISLFGFHVTASDVYMIGSLFSLNALLQNHGKKSAKYVSYASLAGMVFFSITSRIHLMYTPTAFDTTQDAFTLLLNPAPRIAAASIFSYFITQQVDLKLFSFFRKRLGASLGQGCSLLFSQFLDTLLFSFLGLYGLVESLHDIIIVSYLLKMAIVFLAIPFARLTQPLTKYEV